MPNSRNPRPFAFVLVLLTAAASLARAQSASDPAEKMPSGTLAFLGWRGEPVRENALIAQGAKLLCAMNSAPHADAGIAPTIALVDLIGGLIRHDGAIGLIDVRWVADGPDFGVALVSAAGADSAKLADALETAIRGFDADAKLATATVNGCSVKTVRLGDSPLVLHFGVHKAHFVASLGESSMQGAIRQIDAGRANSLAENAELKLARAKSDASGIALSCCGFVDIVGVLERVRAVAKESGAPLPEQAELAIDAQGLKSLKSLFFHCGTRESQSWFRCFLHAPGERKGLLSIWKQSPVGEDDLRVVPRNAYWASVCNFDLHALWEAGMVAVEEIEPDAVAQVNATMAATRQFLGFSIPDDLLAAFGDTWAFFDAPHHGGIFGLGSVLVVKAVKPDAIDGIVRRLVELAAPPLKGENIELAVRTSARGSNKIHYVCIGGAPSPVAPAWAIVGDRVVVGLFPQTVAAALDQLDPKTRKDSLLDHPEFKALRAKLGQKALSWSFVDERYFSEAIYPFLMMYSNAISSLAATAGAKVDLLEFPTLNESLVSEHAAVGNCTADADGILYSRIGSGNSWLASIVLPGALATSVLLPSVSRARELANRSVSASNLRNIGSAIRLHADANGGVTPATLEPLLSARYITQEQLHSPSDEDASGPSYKLIGGQDLAKTDPRNIVAYEQPSSPDGTNVAYADGSVEFLRMSAFRRALVDTYRRLGRTREIPPEYAGDE